MKKWIPWIASLILIVPLFLIGVLSTPASAATSGTTGDCTWTLDGTVLTISGNGAMGNNDRDIVDGSFVTTAPWGYSITEVVIEDGVTSLGMWAFDGCNKLVSVTLGNSVTDLGCGSFGGCSSLTSITLPDGVTSIPYGTFDGCTSLASITIPDSVTCIDSMAFEGCKNLAYIVLPDSVTLIYEYAFSSCANLKDVWYEGSDRSGITIVSDNTTLIEATWHYNSCMKNAETYEHIYDNACDTTCNECDETRTAPHVYDNACDADCNECGNVREITHDYSAQDKNSTEHWMKCSVCGVVDESSREAHGYENDCDATCDACGNVRIVPDHVYDNACDTTCNECGNVRTVSGHVYDNDCDADCNECDFVRVAPHNAYDNACDPTCNECGVIRDVPDHVYDGETDGLCNECGYKRELSVLAFYGANLTLENDLTVNFAVQKSLIDNYGFTDFRVIFKLGNRTVTVSEYHEDQGYYVFAFKNLAPQMLGDEIAATLHATIDGTEFNGNTVHYTVTKYCKQVLADANASQELKILIADLMQYAAAAQRYTNYRTDSLVTDLMTAEEKKLITAFAPEATSVSNAKYKEIASPSVQWTGASLNLYESVSIQLQFTASDITGLTAEVRDTRGRYLATLTEEEMTKSGSTYTLFYKGLNAGEMTKAVLITFYDAEGNAVSNTLRYSVESYVAIVHQYGGDAKLVALLDAMLNYGNAALDYYTEQNAPTKKIEKYKPYVLITENMNSSFKAAAIQFGTSESEDMVEFVFGTFSSGEDGELPFVYEGNTYSMKKGNGWYYNYQYVDSGVLVFWENEGENIVEMWFEIKSDGNLLLTEVSGEPEYYVNPNTEFVLY